MIAAFGRFVASRLARGSGVLALATAVIVFLGGPNEYPVWDGHLELWLRIAPVAPLLWGVIAGFFVLNRFDGLEREGGRLRWCRAVWGVVLTGAPCLLYPAVAAYWGSDLASGYVRNSVFAVAVGLLGARWLEARAAWMPSLVLLVAVVFAGADSDGRARWWALPLLPSDLAPEGSIGMNPVAFASWAVAAATALVALGIYVVKDSRGGAHRT